MHPCNARRTEWAPPSLQCSTPPHNPLTLPSHALECAALLGQDQPCCPVLCTPCTQPRGRAGAPRPSNVRQSRRPVLWDCGAARSLRPPAAYGRGRLWPHAAAGSRGSPTRQAWQRRHAPAHLRCEHLRGHKRPSGDGGACVQATAPMRPGTAPRLPSSTSPGTLCHRRRMQMRRSSLTSALPRTNGLSTRVRPPSSACSPVWTHSVVP